MVGAAPHFDVIKMFIYKSEHHGDLPSIRAVHRSIFQLFPQIPLRILGVVGKIKGAPAVVYLIKWASANRGVEMNLSSSQRTQQS